MIKKILLFLILTTFAWSSDRYEKTLYEKIFPLIFHKKVVKIYTDKSNKDIFEKSKKIITVNSCERSDMVFGIVKAANCQNKPLFVTTYREFETNGNAIGAFYWRKGRPQLRFKEKSFKKFHLILPEILRKYAQ